MTPQQGEFWIVTVDGKPSVGRCSKIGKFDGWTVIGHDCPILTQDYRTLKAIRKVDVDAAISEGQR